MLHRISHIENRLDSEGELLIECFGDVEIYLTAEQFKEIAEVFATANLRREVAAVINEMSRYMPNATEDWRARLTEALP